MGMDQWGWTNGDGPMRMDPCRNGERDWFIRKLFR